MDKRIEEDLDNEVKTVRHGEDGYPKRLLNLDKPPMELFYYGELPKDDVSSIAVIGARNCSEYGRYMAECITKGLVEAGVQIISGMAMGIDGIAQMCALNSGGKSYGVLGCGPDICYPRANKALYERLKNEGGVISEYPVGMPAVSAHFPVRNRIISGFSDGIVVVEAKQKSGTLITVDAALAQGKDIFVIPGRVTDALSVGCNSLIKQGAYPVQSAEDILEIIVDITQTKRTVPKDYKKALLRDEKNVTKDTRSKIKLEREENMVYSCFDFHPRNSMEVANALKMDMSQLSCIIIGLEIKGYIREVGRNSYVRTC